MVEAMNMGLKFSNTEDAAKNLIKQAWAAIQIPSL
jgi:hypothetical protein